MNIATYQRKLIYVDDGVPEETTELFRSSCAKRNVDFVPIHAPAFDYRPESQLEGGELLFRPATSIAAIRTEQFLYATDVATLYEPPDALFHYSSSPMIHQRAGLPIPRTIYYAGSDRQLLRSQVSHLGGFPILIKIPGYSRGIGVIRVDTLPALFSLMDYLTAIGVSPSLSTFVADAVHWRLTVVGDRVVSAYKNVLETDDFRTYASDSPDDYFEMVPPQMEELAVKAVQLLRVQFGGVDLLAHSSGRLYFLEANFPAYFANAQRVAGHDISGAILDCLLGKANRR